MLQLVEGLSHEGGLDIHARGNRLLGFVLAWRMQGAGDDARRVVVEIEPDNHEAADWALERLLQLNSRDAMGWDIRVNGEQTLLRQRLLSAGVGVQTVSLLGPPGPALVMLQARWEPLVDLGHIGCVIGSGAPSDVVGSVVSAQRRSVYVPASSRQMVQVIRRAGRVLGRFSVALSEDDCWGTVGDIDVDLGPEVRRPDVLRTVYGRMLDFALSRDADMIRIETSRPSVLALSRVLGARVFETRHDFGASLETDEFDSLLESGGAPSSFALA